jgi:hypothetical protein
MTKLINKKKNGKIISKDHIIYSTDPQRQALAPTVRNQTTRTSKA